MLSSWVGAATGLTLNFTTTYMNKVEGAVLTTCGIKFPANNLVVSRIDSCVRPYKRLKRGGWYRVILLGFELRHKSNLMLMRLQSHDSKGNYKWPEAGEVHHETSGHLSIQIFLQAP